MWGCFAHETDETDPLTEQPIWAEPADIPLQIDDEEVWRCPRRPIKDDPVYWQRLLLFWKHYKEGHLPDAGPITRQSFRALTLFGVMDDTMVDVEKAKADEANRPRGRPG